MLFASGAIHREYAQQQRPLARFRSGKWMMISQDLFEGLEQVQSFDLAAALCLHDLADCLKSMKRRNMFDIPKAIIVIFSLST